jgi:hypothetical protein
MTELALPIYVQVINESNQNSVIKKSQLYYQNNPSHMYQMIKLFDECRLVFEKFMRKDIFKQMSVSDFFILNFQILFTPLSQRQIMNSRKRCQLEKCSICYLSRDDTFIDLNRFPLCVSKSASLSCQTTCCVYILYCNLCCAYYIGQTNNFQGLISNFLKQEKVNDLTNEKIRKFLTSHFRTNNHNIMKNLTFWIYKEFDASSSMASLACQSFLVHLFTKLNVNILNIWMPDILDNFNLNSIREF